MTQPIQRIFTGNSNTDSAIEAIKASLDVIGGQNINFPKLDPLPLTASLLDVINRCNEIVSRNQK
jgi:hypothetical protein